MRREQIRPIALCLFLKDDMIFVTEYFEPITGQPYYRPLGGGIEFGEYAQDAVQRELHEEINAEIENIKFVGVLENIFTLNGNKGHQICMMYTASFVEAERKHSDYRVIGTEEHETFNAMWKPLSMFRNHEAPLYPDGLLNLIEQLL